MVLWWPGDTMHRSTLATALVALLGGIAAGAEPPSWRLAIDAGPVDRSNLPLRTGITVPEDVAGETTAWIEFADGSRIPGQIAPPRLLDAVEPPAGFVARDLVFVLPKLPADATIEVTARAGGAAPPERMRWQDEPAAATLLLGSRPLLRYEMPAYDTTDEAAREKTYKPFHHVFDPATGIRLTKGDGGLYTHHRGIFFGYNRITHGSDLAVESDCWHCKGRAHQEHTRLVAQEAGAVEGLQRVSIDWIGSDGSTILDELREVAAMPVSGGTLIDFSSRLHADAAVHLDGDPQHAGVHFRASNEVAETTKSETYYLHPGHRAPAGEFHNWPDDAAAVDLPWHGASIVIGGQRYTVIRVADPDNPGESRMSERDYGRFGSYFVHDLSADAPLDVGYRFWVQPGEMTLEEAERIAADYRTPARITVLP